MLIFKYLPTVSEPRLYLALERSYLSYFRIIFFVFGTGILAKELAIQLTMVNMDKLRYMLTNIHLLLTFPSIILLIFIAVKFKGDLYYISGGKMVEASEIIDPRIYMAAERTFLAWLRTAIGLIAFGFVVVKFNLFLKQLSLVFHTTIHKGGHFTSMGMVFIVLGIATFVVGSINFSKTLKQVDNGCYRTNSMLYAIYGVIVGVCTLVLAIMVLKMNL